MASWAQELPGRQRGGWGAPLNELVQWNPLNAPDGGLSQGDSSRRRVQVGVPDLLDPPALPTNLLQGAELGGGL